MSQEGAEQGGVSGQQRTPARVWGVTRVRNEADIIELTVRHMLGQGLEHLLIVDNISIDDTRAILDRLARELPITVVDDEDRANRQAESMTALANSAAAAGAEWIVPFDADELWRAREGTLQDTMSRTGAAVLVAPVYDHHPRPNFRRGSVVERMPWNRTNGLQKVAFRWQSGAAIGDGNHGVTGVDGEARIGELLIDHYPFRSWDQFKRKILVATAAVDALGDPKYAALDSYLLGQSPMWRIRMRWWRLRMNPRLRRRARDFRHWE
jgi:glycosyltransferase involved in cell wall biosynthesis